MDSNPDVEDLVLNQPSRPTLPSAIVRKQPVREEKHKVAWGPHGQQKACSDQPMNESSETLNTLGNELHGVCSGFNCAAPNTS